MSRVLVTGATGLLGSQLVRQLLHGPDRVVCLSRKVGEDTWRVPEGLTYWKWNLTEESTNDALSLFQPDTIFHLAADPRVRPSNNPCDLTYSNVILTHYLLEAAPRGCRFVLASSASVYGDNSSAQMPSVEGDRPTPTSAYGATKVAAEALVEAYTALGRVNGLSLRFCALVGKGAGHGLLPDLVRKVRETDQLELLGDEPGSTKPYLHAADAARALVYFAGKEGAAGALNVGQYDSVSVLQVARVVMRALNKQRPVVWLGEAANWAGDNRHVHTSPRLAYKMGWRPEHEGSLEAVRVATLEMRC